MGWMQLSVSVPREMYDWMKKGHKSPSRILQYRVREMMMIEEEKENQEGKG